MCIYAYIRVSTQMQTLENQMFEINQWCKKNGKTIDKWIYESVSGTIPPDKRKLGKTIRKMNKGDIIISTEISRLGRNMLMIMSILNSCCQKGIHIYTIKDNFNLSDDINSKIIAFAFALAAEIERKLISQRTKEALLLRKQNGVKLGRPIGKTAKVQRIIEEKEAILDMIHKGLSITKLAKKYKVHRNTLSKLLKEE